MPLLCHVLHWALNSLIWIHTGDMDSSAQSNASLILFFTVNCVVLLYLHTQMVKAHLAPITTERHLTSGATLQIQ